MLIFGKKYSCNHGKLIFFKNRFIPFLAIHVTEILKRSRGSPWTPLGRLTVPPYNPSYKIRHIAMLHYLPSLSDGKTQSSNLKVVAAKSLWNYA